MSEIPYSSPQTGLTVTDEDIKYLHLLEYIDEVETLMDTLHPQLAQGFLSLSRANFASGLGIGKKFGQDYWDYGERDSHVHVCVATGEFRDLLQEQNDKVDEKAVENAEAETSGLRSRNSKLEPKKIDTVEAQPVKFKNQIRMFNGGMVPLPLRQSQQKFKSCLPIVVKIAQLRQQISDLMDELGLEKPQPLEKKDTAVQIAGSGLFDIEETLARLSLEKGKMVKNVEVVVD